MTRNYELFGDIILIDSTYRVNHYNIPLIVYSGINAKGHNVIFALALVNDESEATHRWCLKEFFHLHLKYPKVCITDQDLALMTLLDKDYPQITHFLCQWHIKQNFKKHCSYLQTMNLKETYDKILALPFLKKPEDFESEYEAVISLLKSKKFTKSFEYLGSVYKKKLKWASCYTPQIFTAGIHTTSRIESVNALIKSYVNSNSEVSDLFDFIIAFEEREFLKIQNEELKKNEETHPLMKELRSKLSQQIFNLHLEQNTLSYRYLISPNELNPPNRETQDVFFKVKSMDSKDENHFRLVKFINGNYSCECEIFLQCGIICRHIFYVSHMHQEKDLSNLQIHPRWLIQDDAKAKSLKELFGDLIKETKIQNEGKEEESKQINEDGSI